MGIKDPTAWKDDLTFYKTEESVADDVEAMEPLLLHGGSKVAAGFWLTLVGIFGTAFGAVLLSPESGNHSRSWDSPSPLRCCCAECIRSPFVSSAGPSGG